MTIGYATIAIGQHGIIDLSAGVLLELYVLAPTYEETQLVYSNNTCMKC